MRIYKRNNKSKFRNRNKSQLLKISVAVFIIATVSVLAFTMCQNKSEEPAELRGVWISYGDFETLGLRNKSEAEFTANAEEFLDLMDSFGINTVYLHVRAFRDAVYQSEYFPTADFFWSCSEPVTYDALQIMTDLAHSHGMELHAWLNPYRNTSFSEDILDPADQASTDEVLRCVREITGNYDVDGIHFDDYFYEEDSNLPDSVKMNNVNKMIKQVYEEVHSCGKSMVFGISPAGNIDYCESIGADVRTWLSEEGYVDYIIPQIYWTDRHTSDLYDKMFTDTLNQWSSMNSNGTKIYAGLALYKAGTEQPEDPGWSTADCNIAEQIQLIRRENCRGFVFFSAGDFTGKAANEELDNYRELVIYNKMV